MLFSLIRPLESNIRVSVADEDKEDEGLASSPPPLPPCDERDDNGSLSAIVTIPSSSIISCRC